jgi:hypothetical protein
MPAKFDNQISVEHAYQLICLLNSDVGGRDAVSARGWIIHSSWYGSMELVDGSTIYRDPAYGFLRHSNYTAADVLDMFDIDWRSLDSSEVN